VTATPQPELLRVLSTGTFTGAPVELLVAVAAAAGFDGISLRPADVRRWVAGAPGRTPRALRALLQAAGLRLTELDPVMAWYPPSQAGQPSHERETETRETLDLAADLGAPAVSALVAPDAVWDLPAASRALRTLAAEAAQRDLLIQLEPFSWSPLRDLTAASRLLAAADHPANAGLLVDTWHLARSGISSAVLDRIDVARVFGVQVSDGAAVASESDLAADNRGNRRWPGEGELQPGLRLRQLTRRGWRGPVGVEVFASDWPDPFARARRARESLDQLLAIACG
jgi:4-hydroxyphenylpyruvate dioxygenase